MVKRNKDKFVTNHKKLAKIVFITLIFVVLLIGLTSILVSKNLSERPIAISEINVSFMIGARIGLAVDTDMLNMGRIPPGNTAQRMFYLYPKEEPVQVYIELTPEIADYIKFTPNNFIMEPDVDNVSIKVILYNTDNLSYGNYTGKTTIYYFSVDE